MSARVPELEHLARDVREDGYRRAAVLGMGGSSLAPELFSRVFGWAGGANGSGAASPDGLELRILDSTHPDAVRGFRSWASEQRTLFLVSSKSGSTTEPNAFQAAMGEVAPALDFIAITDPDTPLADLARAQEFRAIVTAPTDVGGRYSALSVFGLVPAALHGVDVGALLDRAGRMADDCRLADAAANPGLRLGAYMGEAALAGRDKLTILTGERLAAFGDWTEQLVAESTGKAGTGIVPIVGEPLRDPDDYAGDRCFVRIRLAGEHEPELDRLCRRARSPRPPRRAPRAGRSPRGRRGVRALGGGDRGSRDRARHRPVRPAQRHRVEGRDHRAAGGVPRARSTAAADAARQRARGRGQRRPGGDR